MRKQLHRVKQLADQTFYKAEKTEALTDDMQAADKHVEQIRAALLGLNKRLGNSKTSEANSQDPLLKEKRIKKCPEYILGQTMLENAGEEGPMSYTLNVCGKAQMALANEIVEHESKVEQYVTAPLQLVLDTDIPNISKHKKSLQRSILDMDSVKTRYHQATAKHNSGGLTAIKLDSLKDELDDAEAKVESYRDLLASDMFQLKSKETQLAQTILQYIKLQRAYHESALHCLEDVIPDLESFINNNEMKPVYNYPLEEHLRVTNRKIALPIQLCVCALRKIGMREEGLFRVAGSASKLRRLKLSFDACCLNLQTALEYRDPHVIAGALKSYLRELPDPLLTYELYHEWMSAAKQPKLETRLPVLYTVIHKLPPANYENLRFLIKFFAHFTSHQSVNKMSPHNLAIVVAPNLIWGSDDISTIAMDAANYSSLIVEDMISYADDYFFPGEIDFEAGLEPMLDYNDTDSNATSVGMRRCMSNSSLNDIGDSPTQGSPRPATRRKNKPAPTPPSGMTPDKHQQQHHQLQQHVQPPHNECKRPDEKPPPAPDKPPRPYATATLNRVTYKAQKHDQVTTELIQPLNQTQQTQMQGQTPLHISAPQPQTPTQIQMQSHGQTQDNISNNKSSQPDKIMYNSNRNVEDDIKPLGFDAGKAESAKEFQNSTETPSPPQHSETSSIDEMENHKVDSEDDQVNSGLIGFEALNLKASESTMDDIKLIDDSPTTESTEKLDSPKLKPVQTEKFASTSLERRKPPVATPRYLSNANTPSTNHQEDSVELRKKTEGNNVAAIERNSKPVVPERPANLVRPSSLLRQFPRHSIENLDSDPGPLTLERTHVYSVDKQQVSIIQVRGANSTNNISENNGTSSTINLQRSPSVGSRPSSMSVSATSVASHLQQQQSDKPPRPEPPDHVRAHSRTRSEGNIIDVPAASQTQQMSRSSGIVMPQQQQQQSQLQQQQSTSPRFYQRPPRPQPPPPPPPVAVRPKNENESTNL